MVLKELHIPNFKYRQVKILLCIFCKRNQALAHRADCSFSYLQFFWNSGTSEAIASKQNDVGDAEMP